MVAPRGIVYGQTVVGTSDHELLHSSAEHDHVNDLGTHVGEGRGSRSSEGMDSPQAHKLAVSDDLLLVAGQKSLKTRPSPVAHGINRLLLFLSLHHLCLCLAIV